MNSEFPTDAEPPAPEGVAVPLGFRDSYPIFAAVMRRLAGGDLPRVIAEYFGPRINAQMVRDWRNGRSGIPAWVLQKARADSLAMANTIAALKPGPGKTGDIQKRYGPKRKKPR